MVNSVVNFSQQHPFVATMAALHVGINFYKVANGEQYPSTAIRDIILFTSLQSGALLAVPHIFQGVQNVFHRAAHHITGSPRAEAEIDPRTGPLALCGRTVRDLTAATVAGAIAGACLGITLATRMIYAGSYSAAVTSDFINPPNLTTYEKTIAEFSDNRFAQAGMYLGFMAFSGAICGVVSQVLRGSAHVTQATVRGATYAASATAEVVRARIPTLRQRHQAAENPAEIL